MLNTDFYFIIIVIMLNPLKIVGKKNRIFRIRILIWIDSFVRKKQVGSIRDVKTHPWPGERAWKPVVTPAVCTVVAKNHAYAAAVSKPEAAREWVRKYASSSVDWTVCKYLLLDKTVMKGRCNNIARRYASEMRSRTERACRSFSDYKQ